MVRLAIQSHLMLIDVVLACAAVAAAGPAVLAASTGHANVTGKTRLRKQLYGSLLLAEKLPADAIGAAQIARDIDRQTLHVAYVAQYPQRAREIAHLAAIGAVVLAAVVGYYLLLAGDAALLTLLIVLVAVAVAALWFERAAMNFSRNDRMSRQLFAHFGAPEDLVRPRTELVAKAPALSVDAVFSRAADVRDAHHGAPMTTLDAVNAVLAAAHSHFDWRTESRRFAVRVARVDYRTRAEAGRVRAVGSFANAHDWVLRHLLGPAFSWRLSFLDQREHRRTARAHDSGDVFGAAWLSEYYRDERRRLARRWSHLRATRHAPRPSHTGATAAGDEGDCAAPAGSPPAGNRTGSGVGERLEAPGARRAPVGVGDLVGALAHRVAEADQDVVERGRRLVPPGLLDAVGLGGLSGPDRLQRRYLRAQIVQRRVEPRRRVVNLLTHGVLDLVEVV